MSASSNGSLVAAIALGSNLGDRFHNIELALRLLEVPKANLSPEDLQRCGADVYAVVVDTSFMYETSPMYVIDQHSFINCACLVRRYHSIRTPTNFLNLN